MELHEIVSRKLTKLTLDYKSLFYPAIYQTNTETLYFDRHTDRHTYRHKGRQTDTQGDRRADRQTERQAGRENRQTYRLKGRQAGRQQPDTASQIFYFTKV